MCPQGARDVDCMDIRENSLDKYIADKFKDLLPKETKDRRKLLFHYTTTDVLEILSRDEADIYLTHCSALNDDAEFLFGLKVVRNYFKRHPNASNGVSMENFDDFRQYPEACPWTFSFTTECDSLYQWIAYTDRNFGGVNIGVDYNELQKLVQKNNQVNASSLESVIFLAPCFYVAGTSSDKTDELMDFAFGGYRNYVLKSMPKPDEMTKSQFGAYVTICISFIIASLIKGQPFCYEHEWRIVTIPSAKEIRERFAVLGGRPRVASNLFGFNQCFNHIWREVNISPHGDREHLVRLILSARSVSVNCQKSKITYNGR